MPQTADILVVGAGIMGASVAYAAARAGMSVVVSERNFAPGQETTARSGAIIRAHYGVPQLAALAHTANKRFRTLSVELGRDCGYNECGYCVIVDEEDTRALRANVAMHQGLGVDVSLLTPEETSGLCPALITDDVALAAFEPRSGYADPAKTVSAFALAAAEAGAKFHYSASVTAARRSSGGWEVTLGNGDTISAGQVAICTGNWSGPVGALFGIALPVVPVRAQIVVMPRPDGLGETFPVISDLINLAYFRQEAGGIWVGSSDSGDLKEALPQPEGFDEAADPPAIRAASVKAKLRFTGYGDEELVPNRSFSGLYETTPDWQPIIDSVDDTLHVAAGFSGHGFKLAPVVGDIIAGRLAKSPYPLDTSLFALERFARGMPISSIYAYRRARFLR